VKIGKYYLSFRKLWTAILAVAAALKSAAFFPPECRPYVDVVADGILAFNISPFENWDPAKVEGATLTAVGYAESLLPPGLAEGISDLVLLLKAAQANYAAGGVAPAAGASGDVAPGPMAGAGTVQVASGAAAAAV